VAKPNVVGIEFEQLETRSLLNGTAYSAALLVPAFASGMEPGGTDARLERGGAVAPPDRIGGPQAYGGARSVQEGFGAPRGPYFEYSPFASTSFIPNADETVIYVSATDVAPPAVVDARPPREFPYYSAGSGGYSSLPPEVAAQIVAKHTSTSATSAEGDSPTPKTNPLIVPTPQAGKGDTTAPLLPRDTGVALISKANSNLPIPGKDDRLTSSPIDTIRSTAAEKPPLSLQGYVSEPRSAAAPTPEALALALQRASLAGTVNEAAAYLSSAEEPACPLLTSIVPFDFAALEVSIKDFFNQINQAGLKLSENHVNLLFSSGMVAVAATLALEISRRKTTALAQAPALDHAGSIPYSDYL
jgi:hypothetical protein